MDFGRESGNETVAKQLVIDYRTADLPDADRALCDYAAKLTLIPGEMDATDLDRLRAHGFDDDAMTIATQVISYFNYINRIADGLGVDPEDWMEPSHEEWNRVRGQGYLETLPASHVRG